MGSPVTRISVDIGIGTCPCHDSPVGYTTLFVTGAPHTTVEGHPAGVVGTVGVSSCGHSTIALTGSSISDSDNAPLHRIGDTGSNCGPYTVVTGSPVVESD